ncbi:(2Fe-2S)-binding protein [Bacillaceae bacterium SAS-127]|nr:(2Fe-2S)-binding protein [Bacillaceae bacterium SAS-127]
MKECIEELNYTLPYNDYVDPEVFEKERKQIFLKSWIFVGHTSQVERVGDFFTFEIGGESIIITKEKENNLKAFYNICPHRGTKVERTEKGNKKVFMCSYHGWTFHLDGTLNKAPNFKTSDLGAHSCMTSVQLEIYRSLIFINFDPNAKPLVDSYKELTENLDSYTFFESLKQVRTTKRMIQANWKAIIDNYLECDHCQIAHPAFSKTFDMKNYHIDTHESYTCQYSKLTKGDSAAPARFYWIWPNLMISIYPGDEANITTSQIIPISPNQSLAIYNYYFQTNEISEEQEELIKFVDQVRKEDFELVELLQSGLHTKAFSQGIYSPSENGLKHFHNLIKEAMTISP